MYNLWKWRAALVAAVLALSASAQTQGDERAFVRENMEFAAGQCRRMAAEAPSGRAVMPHSTDSRGRVVRVPVYSWTAGFFPGTLWYLADYLGDEALRDSARSYTRRMEPTQHYTGNHDVGFMMYCSYGNALRFGPEEGDAQVLATSARTLCKRFDERVGAIKSWNSFRSWHGDSTYTYPVIIDNMMNLELLMWAADRSGDKSLRDMAVSHADKTLKHHFRPDFSSCHLVSYDTISGQPHLKQTHQGLSDSSAWSRGQAWGLYGYTCMYRLTGDARYLEQARGIAGFLINHRNMPADGIPYWDFDAPALASTPRDASAAAIMASALVELSGFVPAAEGERYMAFAEKQIRTLASPEYTAPAGENGGFILRHSTGAYPFSSEVDVPLTYADYYYLEALTRIKRRLQP